AERALHPSPRLPAHRAAILQQPPHLEWREPVPAPSLVPPPATARQPTSGPMSAARTPYVGREHERAEFASWLDQARKGNGSLVLIGGEPGVGKTPVHGRS